MGVFVGRSREVRMCRCAVDALRRKKRCKRFRRVGFAEDVIINESEREEMAVTMEEEPREAAEWWQFVTSTKMLHTKRLQRLWREQQFLKRIVGGSEYLDMQAGVAVGG